MWYRKIFTFSPYVNYKNNLAKLVPQSSFSNYCKTHSYLVIQLRDCGCLWIMTQLLLFSVRNTVFQNGSHKLYTRFLGGIQCSLIIGRFFKDGFDYRWVLSDVKKTHCIYCLLACFRATHQALLAARGMFLPS